MIALSLTGAVFLLWSMIGLAIVALVSLEGVTSTAALLTAPLLGAGALLPPLFVASEIGMPVDATALPITVTIGIAACCVLIVRRPALTKASVVVIGIVGVEAILVGSPMLSFGLNWIANANDDMANYVLSATKLLRHGLIAPLDVHRLAHDSHYPAALQGIQSAGARPGSDLTLAALSSVSGRPPYAVFMPFILAANMATICGAAALAAQGSKKAAAAPLAALIVATSPLATVGVLQQLLPQVWGLGIACALGVWLMRSSVHTLPGFTLWPLIPVALLLVSFVLVYVELAAICAPAYLCFLVVLGIRRELRPKAVLRTWLLPVVALAVVENGYLIREIKFVLVQASGGVSNTAIRAPLFGFTLVPSALPGLVGIQSLPVGGHAHFVGLSIAASLIALIVVAGFALQSAGRAVAAGVFLIILYALGLYLLHKRSDFGLYKTFMYMQPFLAAVVAIGIIRLRRPAQLVAVVALIPFLALQVHTASGYVKRSRDPVDLHHASASDLLPAFRHVAATTTAPLVTVTNNPTLAKLEAAAMGSKPLYFVSQSLFVGLIGAYPTLESKTFDAALTNLQRTDGWEQEQFVWREGARLRRDPFLDNTHADAVMKRGECEIAVPSGSQMILNRIPLPEGTADLRFFQCRHAPPLLIFAASRLGQGFYLPSHRESVSFYQNEHDIFFKDRTFAGFGRYALFRVLNGPKEFRVHLSLTTTPRQDGRNIVPPASVIGVTRVHFAAEGLGSAQLVSEPVRPRIINHVPYILLDMGAPARLLPIHRAGIENLYGKSVPTDPRFLTAYVRDVSILPTHAQPQGDPVTALQQFPSDLADPALEYSGIYEDGWVGPRSYVDLPGGPPSPFEVRAVLPSTARSQHVAVWLNGHRLSDGLYRPGLLTVRLNLPAATSTRRIQLTFSRAIKLTAPDRRHAAARLLFFGLVHPVAPIQRQNLGDPRVFATGVDRDGWLHKTARFTLPGGASRLLRVALDVPASERVVVRDGRSVLVDRRISAGRQRINALVSAVQGPRTISISWQRVVPLAPPDRRKAAARLRFIGYGTPAKALVFPRDTGNPSVLSGVYQDGWATRTASFALKDPQSNFLSLRGRVAVDRQRLSVTVDDVKIASLILRRGAFERRFAIHPSPGIHRVQLSWSRDERITDIDNRQAAALLYGLSLTTR